jgi:hypothetical protein
MRRGLEGFGDDARAWRAAVGARVPVYDRLLEAAAGIFERPAGSLENAARDRIEAAWRERKFEAAYDRPLLLLAALRAEALRSGPRHPLFAAVGAAEVDPEAASRQALAGALADAPARLFVDLATRSVQTNETSRAVAWLWPAAMAGCAGGKRPLALYDIGCSAGLNLVAERLPTPWGDPAGKPLPVAANARIVARHGFDSHPLDVRRTDDVLWLRACVWPGETGRLLRLDQAIAAFGAAAATPDAPSLRISDAADVPARIDQLSRAAPPETLLLAYQTVMRDYLPKAIKTRYLAAMTDWVMAQPAAGPRRIWIELEAARDAGEDPPRPPMALTAHLADGADRAQALTLARCGYHPDRLVLEPSAVAAFTAASAPPSR